MAEPLKRVQVLLEAGQQALLAALAKREKRSVAEVTRRMIALGLEQVAREDMLARRAQALKHADELAASIRARHGGPLDLDVAEDLRQMREERDEHMTDERRPPCNPT